MIDMGKKYRIRYEFKAAPGRVFESEGSYSTDDIQAVWKQVFQGQAEAGRLQYFRILDREG